MNLDRIDVPGEDEARERSWRVAAAAFAEREPERPRRRAPTRVALALASLAVAAAVSAAATPAGRDLVQEIRRVVGVQRAQPALVSLPAPGRVLVSGDAGSWVVEADGSRRLLGAYREASWSPYGRFVVVVGRNELTALEPDGDVRWTLARRGELRFPRWGGTRTDTRIAYLSGTALRVVAGDGEGDRLVAPRASPVPPAWRPGARHVLSYVAGGRAIVTVDVDTRRTLWRMRALASIRELEWSPDGESLLVRMPRALVVLDARGRRRLDLLGGEAAPLADAAFARGGVAFVQVARGRSSVWLAPRLRPDATAARRVFEGGGRIDTVHPSPDGRWLLLSWPAADQWIAVRVGRPRIVAFSGISEQLRSRSFPRVEGWTSS